MKKVNQGSETPSALLRAVSIWMLGHVASDDTRIAEYIKAAGSRALGEQEYGLYLR